MGGFRNTSHFVHYQSRVWVRGKTTVLFPSDQNCKWERLSCSSSKSDATETSLWTYQAGQPSINLHQLCFCNLDTERVALGGKALCKTPEAPLYFICFWHFRSTSLKKNIDIFVFFHNLINNELTSASLVEADVILLQLRCNTQCGC